MTVLVGLALTIGYRGNGGSFFREALMPKQHNPMADRLNIAERGDLQKHEATIEMGQKTFVQVGNALMAIRDGRLYRETHSSFEAYTADRWNYSRPRAYQLIEAAQVVTALPKPPRSQDGDKVSTVVDTERQARELGKVPEAKRPEVLKKAAEATGGKPTASAIREAAKEVEPKERTLKDAKGRAVPPKLRAAWEQCQQLDLWSRQLNALLREVKEFTEKPKCGAYMDLVTFERDIRNCKHALKFAKPYVVCHVCKGDGCTSCRKTGWMPQTSLTRNSNLNEDAA